ncbi:YraN family protein [Salinibacterium sp. SYSU T00001]|uniref:YraN family protein n=1 Tax=Homoserinimonas sedimenticola TaxID=2986805 RepID=UPI0022355E48|nr:YraN family protein [Salinibacterium sedimenticola]MCW4384845.1 YraN family protein [Salinibacterium sedimenticola]
MAVKGELGRWGEEHAAVFLTRAGYTILERNWRCEQGEIDIVAFDGRDTVFVEVKTRSGLGFGHPLEAITAAKLARLRRLALAWCDANPTAEGAHGRRSIRIDAIAIVRRRGATPVVEHLQRVY